MAPQNVDESDIQVWHAASVSGAREIRWERLASTNEELSGLLTTNKSEWPVLVQSAIENIPRETIDIWPLYVLPKLEEWTPPGNRVVILGDAAHAIPPTAGQGASQAFEDVYTFALLLSKMSAKVQLSEALTFWQDYRRNRVDQIIDLTLKLNFKRLRPVEQERLKETEVGQQDTSFQDPTLLGWLYDAHIEEHMLSWVERRIAYRH